MAEDAERETKRLEVKRETERAKAAAEHQARETERQAREFEQKLRHDPELQQEWIRQDNLTYGGLMGIGIVMVQPFLTADALDTSATICVVSFAVAIPLLAALIMVNRHETFRNRKTPSRLVATARVIAQAAAFTGLVAGFWHIHWIAGLVLGFSAMVAVGVQSAGFLRLEQPPSGDGDADANADGS